MKANKRIPLLYSTGVCWLYDNGQVEFEGGEPLLPIIRANSREGRFGNHCRRHYSVNEHSWHVSNAVYEETGSALVALQALWHEAEEGLGVRDINSLLKNRWGSRINKAAGYIRAAVFKILELPVELPDVVHKWDHQFASSEGNALMDSAHLVEWEVPPDRNYRFYCWNPERAEEEFILKHKFYTKLIEDDNGNK